MATAASTTTDNNNRNNSGGNLFLNHNSKNAGNSASTNNFLNKANANNFSVVSVNTGASNFQWPSDLPSSSTSPSSDIASNSNHWEIDEEEVIKRRIYELKRQFHNGRYLIVRHLPRDATEEVCSIKIF